MCSSDLKHVIVGVDCQLLRVFSPFEKKAMLPVLLHSAMATPKAVKKKAPKLLLRRR